MPKRWITPLRRSATSIKRAAARHGIKACIIAAGAVVALGTLNRTTYFSHVPLFARVAASDSAANAKLGSLIAASSAAAPKLAPVTTLGANVGQEHVDLWVSRLTTSMRSGMEISLGRMGKYAEMIGAKLAAKQMPKDLIYLAMIESEFNPNAKSPVKAVGLWQFMAGTAKRFGLTVKGGVDERKDPARATDAALNYLSDLHDEFGSWYLAAAAYNSGEGTVQRALMKVTGKKTGTDEDFFRILPVLPKETQDYVPKLIATSIVGNAPEQYGLVPRDAPPAPVKIASTPSTKQSAKGGKTRVVRKTNATTRHAPKHTTGTTAVAHHARKSVKR